MRAPSASSRSADPQRLVAERLPCLATRQPAPAATKAAVVETLKVGSAAAGPGGVEQLVAGDVDGQSQLAHRARQASQLVDGLALRA